MEYSPIINYEKNLKLLKKEIKNGLKCGYLIEEKNLYYHMQFLNRMVNDLIIKYRDPKYYDFNNLLLKYLRTNTEYAHLFMGRYRYWYSLTDKVDVSLIGENDIVPIYADSVTGELDNDIAKCLHVRYLIDGVIDINGKNYNATRGLRVYINHQYDLRIQKLLVEWIMYKMYYDKKYSINENKAVVNRFYNDYLELHDDYSKEYQKQLIK